MCITVDFNARYLFISHTITVYNVYYNTKCVVLIFSCTKHFIHETPHKCTHPVANLHQSLVIETPTHPYVCYQAVLTQHSKQLSTKSRITTIRVVEQSGNPDFFGVLPLWSGSGLPYWSRSHTQNYFNTEVWFPDQLDPNFCCRVTSGQAFVSTTLSQTPPKRHRLTWGLPWSTLSPPWWFSC